MQDFLRDLNTRQVADSTDVNCETPKNSLILRWTPLNLREYLTSCEGKVWRRENSLRILNRAEQIDAFIEQLMRAAGIEIVE